jgi:uncharacterized protein YegJ (DUF2314 family)
MGEMDLIPGDYRQNRNRRGLLRNFIMVCVLVLCCIGLARMLLTYLIWRENVQVVRLEQQENISEQNKAKSDAYRQQKQVTEQQLTALNELRGRDRVALFLQAIDAAYGNGIWFDSVHFMRQNKTGTLENVPGAANTGIIVVPNGADAAPQIDISQSVEILGHAANHSLLAEFMRTLGAQSSVADLRLIDTSLRNYTTTQVVDFNLALQMDKSVHMQIVEKATVQP